MTNQTSKSKTVTINNSLTTIPDIYKLKVLGKGHDGIVFGYHDLALKLYKHNLDYIYSHDLMTYEKICYFIKHIDLRRIITPIDSLFDEKGVYCGYVMPKYLPFDPEAKNKFPPCDYAIYTCQDFLVALNELEQDFNILTDHYLIPKDINYGSYIYTTDFLHMCDADKYYFVDRNPKQQNDQIFKYITMKLIYCMIISVKTYNKQEKTQVLKNLKQIIRNHSNYSKLQQELIRNPHEDLSTFTKYLIRRHHL